MTVTLYDLKQELPGEVAKSLWGLLTRNLQTRHNKKIVQQYERREGELINRMTFDIAYQRAHVLKLIKSYTPPRICRHKQPAIWMTQKDEILTIIKEMK